MAISILTFEFQAPGNIGLVSLISKIIQASRKSSELCEIKEFIVAFFRLTFWDQIIIIIIIIIMIIVIIIIKSRHIKISGSEESNMFYFLKR